MSDTLPGGKVAPALADGKLEAGDASSLGQAPTDNPRQSLSLWRWILTLVGLYSGALLYGLDTTVAAAVQTPIYEQFGEVENLAWVGIGFPMASVAVILLLGRLYDLVDVKILVLACTALFEGGSALCGGAPDMDALIVGRVIAGIGGAGMYLGALSYISIYAKQSELFVLNALIGLSWGVGCILGPIVGGGFAVTSATWRWAFYINLPIAAILSPVYFFIFPSHNPVPNLSTWKKLRSIDWLGALLIAAAFTLFIVALAFSGAAFAWQSTTAICLWVFWGVSLAALIAQQAFSLFTTPANRIFPVDFLRHRTHVLLYITTSCAAVVNAVVVYYIPLFFAFTRGDGALQAAVRLLPYIVVFITFVLFAGGTLPFHGRWAIYYAFGSVFILAGSAGLFTIRSDTNQAIIYAYEAIVAIGTGLTFQNAYAVLSAKVGKHDRGKAIGFINTAQIGTTALALAIASCLFQNLGFMFLQDKLAAFNPPASLLHAALGGAASTQLQAVPPVVVNLALETIGFTIARVFGTCLAAGALLVVSSALLNYKKLDLSDQAPVFG